MCVLTLNHAHGCQINTSTVICLSEMVSVKMAFLLSYHLQHAFVDVAISVCTHVIWKVILLSAIEFSLDRVEPIGNNHNSAVPNCTADHVIKRVIACFKMKALLGFQKPPQDVLRLPAGICYPSV